MGIPNFGVVVVVVVFMLHHTPKTNTPHPLPDGACRPNPRGVTRVGNDQRVIVRRLRPLGL